MSKRRAWWIAAGIAAAVLAAGVGTAFHFAKPMLSAYVRARVIEAVEKSGNLEVGNVEVSLFPEIGIVIDEIRFRRAGQADDPPLIQIDEASADTDWAGVFARHVSEVRLKGLRITVPPRRTPAGGLSRPEQPKESGFIVDRMLADGALLEILPKDPGREPLDYQMKQLTLHHVGADAALQFETVLENAKPPGEIHSTGKFGPWQFADPATTPVSGKYMFRNADLAVFRGIAGTLSSDGSYSGVLDHINVSGTTDTPDFTVRVSGLPVHLKTQFSAVVDGSNGNTYLQPVNAQFGRSSVVARGAVEGKPGGKGKTVSLDVVVQQGRIQDMLRLSVKSAQPAMTGAVSFHTKMVIPPGDVDIAQKIRLDGSFEIAQTQFSALNVQEKVDALSHRASGDPRAPNDDRVASDFRGRFKLAGGEASFANLTFTVPGADIALNGTYGLVSEQLDFHGTARMQAKLSQMTTGIKSFLLKAVDPFFKKDGAGTVLPIVIEGTRQSPHFGLEFRRKK